jgi:hypothetical protein
MAELISWACRTPRRLAFVIGVPVLLLVIVGSLVSHQHGDDAPGAPAAAAFPSVSAHVPDATPFVTAAVRFVNVWGRLAPGQTPSQWHDAVRGLATSDFAAYLDHVDPKSLTGGVAASKPTVMGLTSTSAIVAVPLSTGKTVEVSVVASDGKSWLVDDVEPQVGN